MIYGHKKQKYLWWLTHVSRQRDLASAWVQRHIDAGKVNPLATLFHHDRDAQTQERTISTVRSPCQHDVSFDRNIGPGKGK